MSLPPFLFSATAPAASARSPFAASTATSAIAPATNALSVESGGTAAATDFRRAFMQLTQHKTPIADAAPVLTEDASPLLAKLNLLLEGDLLPEELRECLRSFLDELQQDATLENGEGGFSLADLLQQADIPQEQLHTIAAAIEDVMADPLMDLQNSPEAAAELREFVDLLTGGKTLPANRSSDAVKLSAEVPPENSNMVPPPSSATSLEPAPATHKTATADGVLPKDLLQGEQGKRVDTGAWIQEADAEAEPVAGQTAKPEVFAGVSKLFGMPADTVIKPETTAAPMSALLSADFELPQAAGGATDPAVLIQGKSALTTGLSAPVEAQLQTAMRVQVAFGHAQWSEALAERTAWLAGQQIHSAELQLDPPELGPLQVRISVHQDQASVSFVSANPQVRDALDQSMTRLRDLLQEQGMQLVDAGVADQQRGGNGDKPAGDASDATNANLAAGENLEGEQGPVEVIDTRYGVDDFV